MSNDADLLNTIRELREAVRARDEFLSIAVHELRNPLHALLLQVLAVQQDAIRVGDADLIRRLERVKGAVERYVQRATTVLEVSRIRAGRLDLHITEVDLAAVVRDAVGAYAAEAAFCGSSLRLSAPSSMLGRCDATALDQIVSNLLSNAIKYGNGQPVEIALSSDGSAARIEVRDKGIGIASEDQARIFEPFEQIVTHRRRVGFGVGLWLVRTLLAAHRGSIAVESSPAKGSTFMALLPLDSSKTQERHDG